MSTPGTYKNEKSEKRFLWKSYPKTQFFIEQNLAFLNPLQKKPSFSSYPLEETVALRDAAHAIGLRLIDLLDYIRLAVPAAQKKLLTREGFVSYGNIAGIGTLYRHDHALFPFLIVEEVKSQKASTVLELAFKTEDLDHLQNVRGYSQPLREGKGSSFRRLSLSDTKGYTLSFVERKGNVRFEKDFKKVSPQDLEEVHSLFGRYRDSNIRNVTDPEEAFKKTVEVIAKAVHLVGIERAASEWVEAEVNYWEKGNRAGLVQGKFQRALGLGWSNKDHITYRNSKTFFPKTLEILSRLGFEKRERLRAEEFTAQILEHPALGVSVFVDVDPPEKKELGTVGLWVKLHGESMLSAGLHHVACRYDFVKVQEVLRKEGIFFRPPFSNFYDLKQAFTEGEKRLVPEAHGRRLLREGLITQPQFKQYVTEGAIYTHLEDIERRNGFKGFNPHSVNKTLRDTGKSLRLR